MSMLLLAAHSEASPAAAFLAFVVFVVIVVALVLRESTAQYHIVRKGGGALLPAMQPTNQP